MYTAENILDAITHEYSMYLRYCDPARLVRARDLSSIAVDGFGFSWNDVDAAENKAYGIF